MQITYLINYYKIITANVTIKCYKIIACGYDSISDVTHNDITIIYIVFNVLEIFIFKLY